MYDSLLPPPTEEQREVLEAARAEYQAQFAVRGYQANRCKVCGEFGVFADARVCPDCDRLFSDAIAAERLRCACLVAGQVETATDRAGIALAHILRPDADYDGLECQGWDLEKLEAEFCPKEPAADACNA
jgi:hypothetical protein